MPIVAYPHKVIIQTATITNDVEVWANTYANVPAYIEPLRGREFWDAQKVNAEATVRIRIRYISGIRPDMRVLYGTRVFNVNTVLNVSERNKETHLMTTEVY